MANNRAGVGSSDSPGRRCGNMRATASTPVIARAATKQSRLFPRRKSGLLRCARNDGCGSSGAKISHCDLGETQHLRRLQPPSRLAMMPPGILGRMAMTAATGVSAAAEKSTTAHVVWASALGTAIEWYDFLIYGTAAALVLNKLFFPSFDPFVGTLAAFSTYAVGFVARPIGGAIIGHYGDRLGRKTMLVATMIAMGLGTFLIGCLPTYSQIGVWAPILLVMPALHPGHRARRRMERRGRDGGRACRQPPRLLRQPGADRLSRRRCRLHRHLRPDDATARSGLPELGLARAVPDQHSAGRRRLHRAAQARGDAALQGGGRAQGGAGAAGAGR